MRFSTTVILTSLLGLASASPVTEPRQFQALLHFFRAAGTEYAISAPTSGNTLFTTGKALLKLALIFILMMLNWCLGQPLAVDKIVLEGCATCTLFGVDGGSFTVVGANPVIVAPPQAITSGSCLKL